MRIAVLGGGPGGYSAAFEAARLGAEVVLVERERLGGTCLNWGCIPTKTILRSAHIVGDTRHAAEYGLKASPATVDTDALRARKEGVVDELVGQVEGQAKRLKVEVVIGEGRLAGPRAIEVATARTAIRAAIEADAVILATGSIPVLLPSIDHSLDAVWTSDEATALHAIPSEVLIIGGGVIGLEFADAYANFGSARARGRADAERAAGQRQARPARGPEGARGRSACGSTWASRSTASRRAASESSAALTDGTSIEVDVVLSAPGRRPNGLGFGFEEAGIEMDRRGRQGRRAVPHEPAATSTRSAI